MGRIYTFYNPKWVWLTCIIIFEIGSAICGAAPNSAVFIFGRAVAGLGTAGMFSGIIVIIVYAVPLYKRPQYMGIFGSVFGLASVAGPLLGGVFTTKVSWRWCFYINLPIGGVAAVIIALVMHLPFQQRKKLTFRQELSQLDLPGTAVLLPCIVCLLLALQWGGTTYAWGSWRVILLLVLFAVLAPLFIYIQKVKGETATVPPRIFFQRSILAGMWWSFMVASVMMVMVYYLPIWFQAIKGASAIRSGIMTLPLVLSLVIASILAGSLTRKLGLYTPWMYATAVMLPIATGLITTFTPTTGHAKWIGTQVFFGFALGLGMQQANVAVQTVLARKDVPTGSALIFFTNSLGGAVFVSVANNVFDNVLAKQLSQVAGIDPAKVVRTGATDLRRLLGSNPQLLEEVLEKYNDALVRCFQVGLALACCAWVGAVFMESRSVKKGEGQGGAARKLASAEGEKGKGVDASADGEKRAVEEGAARSTVESGVATATVESITPKAVHS